MKILITGASGFIGRAIVKQLKRNTLFLIPGQQNFQKKLEEAKESAPWPIVIHAGFTTDFSPTSPERLSTSSNIRNSFELIKKMPELGGEFFLFIGAAGVFGVNCSPDTPRNETHFDTTFPQYRLYHQSLYIQEKILVEKLLAEEHFPYTSLCSSTVYGRDMHPLAKNALTGKSRFRVIPPGGTSGIALSDFLSALTLVIEKKPTGRLILNGFNVNYEEVFETIDRLTNTKKITIPMPTRSKALLDPFLSFTKSGGIIQSAFGYKHYSSAKLQEQLNWKPQKNLEETLREAFLNSQF